MTIGTPAGLLDLLCQPNLVDQLDVRDWQRIVGQARRSQLLSRLAVLSEDIARASDTPERVVQALGNAIKVADTNAHSVRIEVDALRSVLTPAGIPFLVLKGGAYVIAGLPAGRGRVMSDLDILIRREHLDAAESALIRGGWLPSKMDQYDQRYYREWMHELPPMQNLERGSSLDVHHTILPPTACLKPDPKRLWEHVVWLDASRSAGVLGLFDMVLHSAVHLFHDGEMDNALRDLVDIDALLRQGASNDPAFWQQLIERASQMDLVRPLHYALLWSARLLLTPVPGDVLAHAAELGAPPLAIARLMHWLLSAAFDAHATESPAVATRFALFCLYIRAHHLRMPLRLLLPHLTRKLFK